MKKSSFRLSTATLAAATLLGLAGAVQAADVGKAASEATDAARHKIDQKRAESQAKESGPVGKAVNNLKSEYHEHKSKAAAKDAKEAVTGKK